MRVYFQMIPRVPVWDPGPGGIQGPDLSEAPDPRQFRAIGGVVAGHRSVASC